MKEKYAADLAVGDGVVIGKGDDRVVARVEFHDKPIDSSGTTGVRVWWHGRANPSLLAADKVVAVF